MTTLGKYLGGGLPFGAFGRRADIMALFDPETNPGHDPDPRGTRGSRRLAHPGTLNMTAALAAATDLMIEPEIARINALGDAIRDRIAVLRSQFGFSGLKATGFSSAVGLQSSGPDASVLRECFFFHMLQQDISVDRRGFVNLNLATRLVIWNNSSWPRRSS
ncbi:uncharacterized protein PG986_006664 [Apiospora aurea]|uniref:Uncharacterized protein n=1 Tax=Apiospora aurea TaxID=335848 RepID=A0ABR1QAC9_9PEZI